MFPFATLFLDSLGASAQLRTELSSGLCLGRISAVHGDRFRILTDERECLGQCSGALLFRVERASQLPAVGDWVALRDVGDGESIVESVFERRTKFSRRAAGSREDEQIVAANIDLALIVCSLDHDFSLRRIERYLTLMRESGARAAIVLNKADLCGDAAAAVSQVAGIAGDASLVTTSALHAEGIDALRQMIVPGCTAALVGSSGAGKSTLVNRLLGVDRQRTREVREQDSKGRHTTTFRELIPLPGGGAIIDTPGMRELQLWAGQQSLDDTFADIAELAAVCRFGDCRHSTEPGCAVRAALDAGSLDEERWDSYGKLRAEIAWHGRRADVAAALAAKQHAKRMCKAQQLAYRARRRD